MKICKTKLLLFALLLVAVFYSSGYSYEIDTGKVYYIQSSMEYGRGNRAFWDIPGKPGRFKRGQNIQVWDLPGDDRGSRDRAFRFHKVRAGVYEISSLMSYGSRVDVAGGRSNNGTNVALWTRHNGNNQRFRMSYRGNGRWKIYTMTGRVLCLKARSSRNGTNVHIWSNHNGPWAEWVLIPRYSYRAYTPQRQNVRPVMNARIRGLRANIVYTDRFYNKAMRIGNLLRSRGMHIKYTRTNNGNAYAGKLLYKQGFYSQARAIQSIIGRHIRLTPQQGQSVNSYRDKQFNIWVTSHSNVRPVFKPKPYANIRGLTANIVYTDRFYNKAMQVGNLLRSRGMRIRYTRTNNGNAYAGKLLYKQGFYNHARAIQNIIGRHVRLAPQLGKSIKSYRNKQFNIWITRY